MKQRVGISVAALLGYVLGAILVFPMGLGLHDVVVIPLLFVVAGLFSALAAGWAGTLFARDGSATRLPAVLTISAQRNTARDGMITLITLALVIAGIWGATQTEGVLFPR